MGDFGNRCKAMICPSCGYDNLSEARFCGHCGAALAAHEPALTSDATPSTAILDVGVEYAGFWPRVGAWAIDLFVIGVGLAVLSMLFSVSRILFGISGIGPFFAPLLLAGPWLYWVLFTGLRGQTLGKMALGIRVVDSRGRVPGIGIAALREIVGKFVSGIVFLIGFLWVAWDPRKQGWHDKIAATYVMVSKR